MTLNTITKVSGWMTVGFAVSYVVWGTPVLGVAFGVTCFLWKVGRILRSE